MAAVELSAMSGAFIGRCMNQQDVRDHICFITKQFKSLQITKNFHQRLFLIFVSLPVAVQYRIIYFITRYI